MLRAIWSAIVVLPCPWAPPMSISSPGRRPPPIVLSIGTKPVAIGTRSSMLPEATRSFRLVSTSSAERGARVPSPASSFQSASVFVLLLLGDRLVDHRFAGSRCAQARECAVTRAMGQVPARNTPASIRPTS